MTRLPAVARDTLAPADQAIWDRIAVGRNVFQASDPGAMTRKLADLVHGRFESVVPIEGGTNPWR